MLRGPRGSNSVAARIIHETEFDEHSDSADDVLIQGDNNLPVNTNQKFSHKLKSHTKKRRVVRVLDVANTIKKGQEKFVDFPARLHPWTTIKELKQKIHQIKGYHVHRQRLYLNNFELLNQETLDYYGLLQEQEDVNQKKSPLQAQRQIVDDIEYVSSGLSTKNIQRQHSQDLKNNINNIKNNKDELIEAIIGSEIASKGTMRQQLVQNALQSKIVLLKLAPDLAKLSKLNQRNIQRSTQSQLIKQISNTKIKFNSVLPIEDLNNDSCKLKKQNNLTLKQPDHNMRDDHEVSGTLSFEMFGSMQCPQELESTLRDIEKGLDKGLKPLLTEYGTGGTYLLRGKQKQTLAVFKPIDEEAFAPNNPRDHIGPFGHKTFRAGVLSGEAAIREVAAYLIDQGFSGVPPTTMVETSHDSLKSFKSSNFTIDTGCKDFVDMMTSIIAPQNQYHNHQLGSQDHQLEASGDSLENQDEAQFLKIGSLQKYMESEGPLENFSSDLFSVDEVHKIAILDLRIMNLDRNETNILVSVKNIANQRDQILDDDNSDINSEHTSNSDSMNSYKNQLKLLKNKSTVIKLIPIDHSLSIPDTLNVCSFDLIWLSYSQAEKPFSQKSLDFIRNIDIMADIDVLENTFKFRPQCLRNMRISSTLLKKGAKAGLTLANIGEILCRPDDDEDQPSILEQIVKDARTCADMIAQMQTKIKDSQLRLILPENEQNLIKRPRRNSAIMAMQSATTYNITRELDDSDKDSKDSSAKANDITDLQGLLPKQKNVEITIEENPESPQQNLIEFEAEKMKISPLDLSPFQFNKKITVTNFESSSEPSNHLQEDKQISTIIQFKEDNSLNSSNEKQILQLRKKGFRFNRYNKKPQKKKGKKKKKKNLKAKKDDQQSAEESPDCEHTDDQNCNGCLLLDVNQVKTTETRKRGYSEVDFRNVEALKVNNQMSLTRKCDRKIKVIQQRRVVNFNAKTPLSKVERQKQDVISKFLSSSSSSTIKSVDQQDPFKDWDFNFETKIKQPEQNPTEIQVQLSNSLQLRQIDQKNIKIPLKKDEENKEDFSIASKRFSNEFGFRSSKASKFASNFSHLSKSPKKTSRRTTSYVDFRISEETNEEDSDSDQYENIENKQQNDEQLNEANQRGRQLQLKLKKNSSNVSLLSMSQLSNRSSNKKTLLNSQRKHSGQFANFNEPIGDSKDDKMRYIQRQNHDIFSKGSNLFKQRRAKIHLDRDMKWNGPHDEQFFRCFEQQLDIAISRFVKSQRILKKNQEDIKPRETFELFATQ